MAVTDDDNVSLVNAAMSPEARRAKYNAQRPDISHLEEAVEVVGNDLVPLFDVGDRILVERNVRINEGDELWLDTRVYEVREIDDVTGAVKCFDEELKRLAVVGFKHPDMVFKLVPKHGNPLHKQRNRTRKIKRNKRK